TCNKDGKYLRRLGHDQVHTNFPSVTEDGRVIYTRWDYNDRGQIFPQQLFQMFPDGTAQTACYGNNSWFPTTMIHARQIPGTQKIVCIATGHHSDQSGKLLLVDPAKGRQENEGAQLIAPVRETPAVHIDAFGQDGDQFQYPYPLDETHYLITYAPRDPGRGGLRGFGLYFMDVDGKRELLAWDPKVSCNQAIPLAPRPQAHVRPSSVDYRKNTGVYYVQDVYQGPGLKGVTRGTVKSLRVVALDYRAAGIGANGNGGPAGGALVSTPASINNGTWDVKRILGSVPVEDDGSAHFIVPAQTPVYFQLLDEKGCVVQSMRTWSTLQPGETFACVGCHESKNGAPPSYSQVTTKALQNPPRELQPFYGPARGFSFAKEIQPILDRKCIACHDDRSKVPAESKAAANNEARIQTSASHMQGSLAAPSDSNEPKCSIDHDIPRFTWWPHKGTTEWIQYDFKKPTVVKGVEVYWFDDSGRGGCRVPANWKLLYRDGNDWKPVSKPSAYGVERDKYNKVAFEPVTTTALRIEVVLGKDVSGGILKWKVPGAEAAPDDKGRRDAGAPSAEAKQKAFSLLGEPNEDQGAKRKWSDAYLALTQRGRPNRIVNWLNVQSIPPMLPPYFAGAAKSELLPLFEKGHYDVKLTREETDKLAAWIDLLVPFCGDYKEANTWSQAELEKYDRYYRKRVAEEEQEHKNTEDLLASRQMSAK
ncbi:MAG: discoidin domain-containing protein, partial [Planctomycetota bacterium]